MAQTIETDTDDIWDLGMPTRVPWTKQHSITLTLMVPDDHTLPERVDYTGGDAGTVPWALVTALVHNVVGATTKP